MRIGAPRIAEKCSQVSASRQLPGRKAGMKQADVFAWPEHGGAEALIARALTVTSTAIEPGDLMRPAAGDTKPPSSPMLGVTPVVLAAARCAVREGRLLQ